MKRKNKKGAGCPRTVSPPPPEMIKLGKEMVAWVKANDPLHLSAWYTVEKGIIDKDWLTMRDREEFIPYYETAMRIIGAKYLDKRSNVRDSISHRWLRIYFPDARRDDEAKAKYEAAVKKEEKKAENKELVAEFLHTLKNGTNEPIKPKAD